MADLPHRYRCYGATIASEIPLAELPPDTDPDTGPADIRIVVGTVDASTVEPVAEGVMWRADTTAMCLEVPLVATILTSADGTIVVDPRSAGDGADVSTFLLGSPIATALARLDRLVLHGAAACDRSGRTIVVVGENGAGKSTVARAWSEGGALLTDNLAPLRRSGDRFVVDAGPRSQRLWADTLERLGHATDELRRVTPDVGKFVVPLTGDVPDGPRTVDALVRLHRDPGDEGVTVERVDPPTAAATVLDNVFRRKIAVTMRPSVRSLAVEAATAIPVLRAVRPAVCEPQTVVEAIGRFLDHDG